MKKSIIKIFDVILIFFCIILVLNFVISRQKGDDLFFINGYSSAVILSGSMEPTLSIDDLVIIKAKEKYERGDIVVFESENKLIVHRIVKINDDFVVTKGDANNVDDDKIEVNKIKGYVIGHISGIGKVIGFVKSTYGICTLLLLFLTIIFMDFLYTKIKN